ncbi:MAG: terminase large subunit domain-containing protein [Pseudomonadota bacterium]
MTSLLRAEHKRVERLVDVELLRHQQDVIYDVVTPVIVLEGGLGCGKTFTLIMKMLSLAEAQPGVAGLIIEPTHELIGTIILAALDEILPKIGVSFEFRTQWRGRRNVLLLWPGTWKQTPVYLRSATDPTKISGFKVGWFLVDEADQMTQEVWRRAFGRKRDTRAKISQACAFYTPEPGYNWTWARFHENRTPRMRVIEGVATLANRHNPQSYVDELKESHGDDAEQARVLFGKRSAREGLVFRRFDVVRNVRASSGPEGLLEMWCDFNVAMMHWSCWSMSSARAHCIGEVVREDTDTLEHAIEAARWWADVISAQRGYRVPPESAAKQVTCIIDAAGEAASTSSTRSDAEILRQVGFTVRHKTTNPRIDESILATNVALADGWLCFDRAKAPKTTRAVELQPYGPDGKPLKGTGSREKVKAGLDHATDGVRYGVWFHRPVHLRHGNDSPRRAA